MSTREEGRAQLLTDDEPMGGTSAAPARTRWLIVGCVILLLASNHWARDSLGALEVPLEDAAGPFALTVVQYNALTTGYFVPNIFVPLLAGGFAQRFGAANAIVLFCFFAALGNGLVALSAVVWSYPLLFTGRACMGLAYEAVDVLPIGLTSHRFRDCWATMVGVISASNRIGSVANFLVEPVVLQAHGLQVALLLPSAVGATMLLWSLMAHPVDAMLQRRDATLSKSRASDITDRHREDASSNATEDASRPEGSAREVPAGGVAGAAVDGSGAEDALLSSSRGCCASARRVIRLLNTSFFCYTIGLACAYGAVVPFWFIGSKHLQQHFNMSISTADAVMLIPEGSILVLALPVGLLVDRCKLNARQILGLASLSTCLIGVSFLLLAWAPIPAVAGCVLLGSCYAISQSLGWVILAYITPPEIINLCSGFVGSAINVVPALLPLAFTGRGTTDLTTLSLVAFIGAVSLACGAVCARDNRALPHAGSAPAAVGVPAAMPRVAGEGSLNEQGESNDDSTRQAGGRAVISSLV